MIRRAIAALTVAALGVATASPVLAHAPIAGIGSFYNGLLHPLLVPAHLLILLGLGLLLGQHATRLSRWGWGAFVAAFCSGLAAGQWLAPPLPAATLLALAFVTGLMVCLARPMGALPLVILAAAGGLGVGLDSAPEGVAGREVWLALAGTAIGGVLLLSYAGGLAARPTRDWHGIAVRVAGSWTAASAGIVLAFVLADNPLPG